MNSECVEKSVNDLLNEWNLPHLSSVFHNSFSKYSRHDWLQERILLITSIKKYAYCKQNILVSLI